MTVVSVRLHDTVVSVRLQDTVVSMRLHDTVLLLLIVAQHSVIATIVRGY